MNQNKYIVVAVKRETGDVSTLSLMLLDERGKKVLPPYLAGQFITVYFPELGTPEGKAYSISSAPHERSLDITVKAMGEFSRRLVSLKTGDILNASLPYGFFYSEEEMSDLVVIAGGIGVAPFRSMIVDAIKRHPLRTVTLFYSVQRHDQIIYEKELRALEKDHPNLKVIYFITRETHPTDKLTVEKRATFFHRVNADFVLEVLGEGEGDREFLICGSIPFVRDIWRGLRAHNVPEIKIYTEAFFSH